MKKILLLLFLLLPSTVYAVGPLDFKLSGQRLDVLEDRLPIASRVLYDDFGIFESALWDTTSQAGGAMVAIAADSVGSIYHGGMAMLKTKNAAHATTQMRYNGAGFQSLAGKYWEFEARAAINDTANAHAYIGFVTAADSILGETTGVQGAYFKKPAGSSVWEVGVMTTADTVKVENAGRIAAVSRVTQTTFRIIWKRSGQTIFYINGQRVATIARAPDAADLLKPCFEIRANSAAVQTMYVDYCSVKSKR